MPLVTENIWEEFLGSQPNAHILQTAAWGKFKQQYGWYPKFVIHANTGAMVLFRQLPFNRTIAYIPKGPIGTDWKNLLLAVSDLCKEEKAILLYIEPDEPENSPKCEEITSLGFESSNVSIQPRQTIIIPLDGEQADWLQRMKQKTRYNIRLAKKKDVAVERSNDLAAFNRLMKATAERDEFGVHEASYYSSVFTAFSNIDACAMWMATYQGSPLAAIMVFQRGERAWYFYGASNNRERNRMPTYLLQWEAMKWAAERGAVHYDLWGIPDHPERELEEQFTSRSDGLWGVYRFKRGFGGKIVRSAGVYQKVFNKPLYAAYQFLMKYRKSILS